jgi:coenzyme F420-reducing hydrogenase delta subunit
MAPLGSVGGAPRVLVFACDRGNAELLSNEDDGTRVIKLPCVGMLPPSFVDFALSRRFAEGVMLAGCAENDCFHRLGNEWTILVATSRTPAAREGLSCVQISLERAAG